MNIDNFTCFLGGGTAGLTLAARLSEDPFVSVCVLEAGGANLNDPMIRTSTTPLSAILLLTPLPIVTPALFGAHFGKQEYDWGHASVRPALTLQRGFSPSHVLQIKQKLLADRVMPLSRSVTAP